MGKSKDSSKEVNGDDGGVNIAADMAPSQILGDPTTTVFDAGQVNGTHKSSRKRKHTEDVSEEPVAKEKKDKKKHQTGRHADVANVEIAEKDKESRKKHKSRKIARDVNSELVGEDKDRKKKHKSHNHEEDVNGEAVGRDWESGQKHKGGKHREKIASGKELEDAHVGDDAVFVIDTVGKPVEIPKAHEDQDAKTKKDRRSSKAGKLESNTPLSVASGNKQPELQRTAEPFVHPSRRPAQHATQDFPYFENPTKVGRKGNKFIRPPLAQQTIGDHGNPNPFPVKKEKRRAPRNIRKEARAAKQAALTAEARARGEPDPVFPKPLSKQEKRYKKKVRDPTERQKKKRERKLKKQEKNRAGNEERSRIEKEALDAVEAMRRDGTLPDTTKPYEEIIAERRAELIAQAVAEGKHVKGAPTPAKPKRERKEGEEGAEGEADEEEVVETKKQKRLRELGQIELPPLSVPKFKTVTLGIPIPNTKCRGSLKELRRALLNAGLTQMQMHAYVAKALEDKKESRRLKDIKKTERREGRKRARAAKKVARQQGKPPPGRVKIEKFKDERAERRSEHKKNKKERIETTLNNNTTVVLREREKEKRERGEEPGQPSKLEVKQARREARKLVRMAKKGRMSAEEVPEGFMLKRSQKLKLKGNGGRIPTWTAPQIWKNVETARKEAIDAADRANKPGTREGGVTS